MYLCLYNYLFLITCFSLDKLLIAALKCYIVASFYLLHDSILIKKYSYKTIQLEKRSFQEDLFMFLKA